LRLVSAVTARGHMRLMIIGKGSDVAVFIEFLTQFRRRLINASREIFLIVDRGSARRTKKAGAFVATLGGNCACSFGRLMRRTATPSVGLEASESGRPYDGDRYGRFREKGSPRGAQSAK
jgi:hypothetical protein